MLEDSGIFTNPDHLDLAGERQHDCLSDRALVIIAIVLASQLIQVKPSNPVTVLHSHCPKDRAEFRQGVEGDCIVAQHACLLDARQQEDLLDSRFRISGNRALVVCRAQPRGEYEDWLAGLVGRVGWDLDEMEQFRGRGADVEVSVWEPAISMSN